MHAVSDTTYIDKFVNLESILKVLIIS